MTNYVDEKRRRIEQFMQYLRLMGLRRHKVVNDDCFIIFDESAPEDADAPHIKESVAITVDCLANGGSAPGGEDPGEMPPPDWSEPENFRYVQFAFRRDCFYLELPKQHPVPP